MLFEAADDFSRGLAAGEAAFVAAAAFGVGSGDLGGGGGVDGFVGLSVAAAVEAVACDASRTGLGGCGAVGHRGCCFGAESYGVPGVGQDVGCEAGDCALQGLEALL